jgi:hypothetical protein
MRKFAWLIAAGLAAGTTGCIETVDAGYAAPSYGYAPYGDDGGYYTQPAAYYQPVNNYYYSPAPTVITQTRYVPIRDERGGDHRWDGNRDANAPHRDDRPQVSHQTVSAPAPVAHTPPPSPPQPHNNATPVNHHRGNTQDGDGRPDSQKHS